MGRPEHTPWSTLAKVVLSYTLAYTLTALYSTLVLIRLLFRLARGKPVSLAVKPRPLPPPVLQDPQLGQHGYLRIQNVKVHYVENGDKEKPLMLFIHGFPEFWYSWRHQLKEFSKDYWTVAVDMRGYGDSEKPQGVKYYKMKYLIEDVKNIIEALGKEKCILVGHDWGGAIAWNFIYTYPQYIEAYIIMNCPHPTVYKKYLTSNFAQFQKSWYFFFFQAPYLPELFMRMNDMALVVSSFRSKKNPNPITENDLEAYKFIFGKPGGFTCPVNYYRANLIKSSLKRNKDVEVPQGLLIFGDQDLAIETSTAEETAKTVPNLTLQIIPGASHFVQQDEPEEVNKAIHEFLNNIKAI